MHQKTISRLRRARKARGHIRQLGNYRLSVHRTPRHIYAQIVSPEGSRTLVAASTVEPGIKSELAGNTGNVNSAETVGRVVAERAKDAGIQKVAFDRSGFEYHGRVKALADAARESGLKF